MEFFFKHTSADRADLWNYAATVFTTILAGIFVIFQVIYQIKKEEKDKYELNRPKIDITFGVADITDEESYVYGEDFYINQLEKEHKLMYLKNAYITSGIAPFTFRIRCMFNNASNVKIHYFFTSIKSQTQYVQIIDAKDLNNGQTKDFLISRMMYKVVNANTDPNINSDIVPETKRNLEKKELQPLLKYFPLNLYMDKIIVTYLSQSNENCVTEYSFKNYKSERTEIFNQSDFQQSNKVSYERDEKDYISIMNNLNLEKGKNICFSSKLVKLNKRLKNY
ncbi:hypothetical protein [Macrococcus equi]|uniref:hypothetical protein n=1 Tax=Macrococcus equi TaxID=3395462 RepID=UPI0039BEC85D